MTTENMEPRALLVSFANQVERADRIALALIDLATHQVSAVDTDPPFSELDAKGITGTTACDGGYLMCLQSWESRDAPHIIRLNQKLDIVGALRHPDLIELHGIAVEKSMAFAVSTYHDSVVKFAIETMEPIDWLKFRPRPCNDYLHLNDICITPSGRLIASQFGPITKGGVRRGGLIDVHSGEVIVSGLREPHSVRSSNGSLYVLESATGDLLEIGSDETWRRGNLDLSVLEKFLGYSRGLCATGDFVAVGRSGFRLGSRSRLGFDRRCPVGVPGVDKESWATAGVYCRRKPGSDVEWFDLSNIGYEVYSVLGINQFQFGAITAASVSEERLDGSVFGEEGD